MNTHLGLIEIKPEFVQRWKEWGSKLMGELKEEALITLKEEQLLQEHMFLVEIESKQYLGFFSEGKSMPANMERLINKLHRKLLDESRVRRIEGTLLYSIKNNE